MRVITAVAVFFWALCAASAPALADPPSHARRGRAAPEPPSRSVGWANHGRITHGRRIVPSASVRILPGRVLAWGTADLVGLLERTALRVKRQFDAPLTVGDLSAREGGAVGRHRSHQSGRDADVAFFARTDPPHGRSHPVVLEDYVSFDRDGRSLDGAMRFDTARNWFVVQSLLADPRAHVERIFVSTVLRAVLLRHAREVHAPADIVERAERILVQPARVSPHDNHFHVRIACPAADHGCRTGVWLPPPPPRHRRRARSATAR